jgi:8-oxo-dGTP diphosphatase
MLNEKKNCSTDFKKNVRVRVCGILIEKDKILLLKHKSIGELGYLWLPPGGGVEFGESAEETLIREFKEETNLEISIEKYLFTNEMINAQHHAIELFFLVKRVTGKMKLGFDPEFDAENQILTQARFFSKQELDDLPHKAIHNTFNTVKTRDKIVDLKGLITFKH